MTALMFKPFGILIYAGFGGLCLYVAAVRRRLAATLDTQADPVLAVVTVAAASILLLWFAVTGSQTLLAATTVGIVVFALRHSAWKEPVTLLPAAAALLLVLSLAWWRIVPDKIAPLPVVAFGIILIVLTIGLSDPWKQYRHSIAVPVAAFVVAGFLLLIDLGEYRHQELNLRTLAHHWGAYIGPVLHVRSGLVPFFDVPLQYGLGPTMVIAAACGAADCWTGTEFIVIAIQLAEGLLILQMVLAASVPHGLIWRLAATIVVFASVFLWTGSPDDGNALLATPSVGGMRFLPVTVVASMLFFGRPAAAAVALIPALLWSPESAAMSVTVFGLCEAERRGLFRAAALGGGLLTASYAGLVLIHRAIFGVRMDPLAFLEYVLHVPGPLPINPISDAMLLAVVLGLGGWLIVRRSPDPVSARRDRVATFLLFAATSYWLGRSHPNNICNLMPFLVLVSFRVLDRQAVGRRLLADVTGLGLAASVATLAMSPWHSVPYDPRASVDIHAMAAQIPRLEPDIERIRAEIPNPDGLGMADFGSTDTRHPSEEIVWTPMDPSSLWRFVPSERRRVYIQRSAARIRRAGWAIIEDGQHYMFDDLQSGYIVAGERDFDGATLRPDGTRRHYLAACFNPRPDVVETNVGPACPPLPGFIP